MMISTKGRYALRIMIDLAQHDSDTPVSVREIALRQDISGKYMEQIIGVLTRAGLLRSVRGAQGGYRLLRPAEDITAGEILRAVEGELTAIPCLGAGADCPRRCQCYTLDFWAGLNDTINRYVDGVTLAQLCVLEGKANS